MDDLSIFERAVLEKFLGGDNPTLAVFRAQACMARLVSREQTGAGFFLSFDIPSVAPALADSDFHFGDVHAEIDGLQLGAGFVVFIRGGRLHTLEAYTYEEHWPDEISGFSLSYLSEPRSLALPTSTPRAT